jgi:hypothetical protein
MKWNEFWERKAECKSDAHFRYSWLIAAERTVQERYKVCMYNVYFVPGTYEAAGIKYEINSKRAKCIKVYFNKSKTLSRHTAAWQQSTTLHSAHSDQRVSCGARSRSAKVVVSSRFVENIHVKSKSRTSRPTVLTFMHRVLQILTALYARGTQML